MAAALFKWNKETSKTTNVCIKESHIARLEKLAEIEQQSLTAAGSNAKINKNDVLDKILDEFFNRKSVKTALETIVTATDVSGQDTGIETQTATVKPFKGKLKKGKDVQAESQEALAYAQQAETGYGQPNQ